HPAGFAERVAAAAAECARLDLVMLPPDVNRSDVTFRIDTAEDGRTGIRFGLSSIKNVGTGAVEALIEERTQNGPYNSLEEFCRRANLKNANKRMLESLIKAGALDCFAAGAGMEREQYRSTLLFNIDRIMALVQREQKLRDAGQTTMFDLLGDGGEAPLPQLELLTTPSLQAKELLAYEKELLGVYFSKHPFKAASVALASQVDMLINEISVESAGREARLAGIIVSVRPLLTKAGRGFCAATLEDLTGQVEVTVWPDTYEQQRELWAEGKIVRLTARIRQRDDRLDVAVVNAAEFDPQAEGGVPAEVAATVAEVERLVPGRPPEQTNGYRNGNGNGRGRNGNGYKNGYGNGNGGVPAGPPPRVLLRIEITERPDDEADDRRRLNELVQVLTAAPGKDEVS